MEFGVEESADNEREEQRHERLDAADQADRRVCRVGEEMLVVVSEERAEAHNEAPAQSMLISIILPPLNHLSRKTMFVQGTGDLVPRVCHSAKARQESRVRAPGARPSRSGRDGAMLDVGI